MGCFRRASMFYLFYPFSKLYRCHNCLENLSFNQGFYLIIYPFMFYPYIYQRCLKNLPFNHVSYLFPAFSMFILLLVLNKLGHDSIPRGGREKGVHAPTSYINEWECDRQGRLGRGPYPPRCYKYSTKLRQSNAL